MSYSLESNQSVIVNSTTVWTNKYLVSTAERLEVDVELSAGLTDSTLNIGVAATSKVKFLMIQNTGVADITGIKLDAGTVTYNVKIGEAIIIAGAKLCEQFLNAWSAATTALVMKVTTPAGPNLAHLKVVMLMDQ